MILTRYYEDSLAHASYLVGCPDCGQAIVIDPGRDVEVYLRAAAKENLKIVAVTETHIHADLLSGVRELAVKTGATLYLSGEGEPPHRQSFEGENVKWICHGDEIRIGKLRFDVLHTPGHTPEHLSFVLTDEQSSPEPAMIFSGDFVFVGEVGRPDLLEVAVGVQGSREPGARTLYRSIQSLKNLPDHVLIWPAHGAGSACGKSLGSVPVTTLGYEKRANWAFRAASEDEFVNEVLTGQPDPPRYFATMKRLNAEGQALRKSEPPRKVAEIPASAVIVDLRAPDKFAARHAKGSLNMPLYGSFVTSAGWFLPYDRDLHLIAETPEQMAEAVRRLSLIGLDRVVSWSEPASISDGQSLVFANFADGYPEGCTMLDIRSESEFAEGHIEGSINIPLGKIPQRVSEVPHDRPVAVYCEMGGRSPVAASLVQALGYPDVVHMDDGYLAYLASLQPSY